MKKFESERNTLFSVILGFISRIHAKHNLNRHPRAWLLARPEDLDSRVKPEYDNQWNFTKGLDIVRQCAVLLERRVQSSTRVRKAQAVTRQTNPIGRSMIEMLGVLAIIGVLSVGGIAGYTKAMEKIHVNKIVNMISDISTTIKTAYISQKTYDNFGSDEFIENGIKVQDLGLLPPEYTFEFEGEKYIGLSSPLTIINPVGYGHPDYSALSIGVRVPQNLCVPLLTYDWRNADMKGILIGYAFEDAGANIIWGHAMLLGSTFNCNNNSDDDEIYFCIESKEQHFKPVSPAVAAKYCESTAADIFGTGQKYVEIDLLADVKVLAP